MAGEVEIEVKLKLRINFTTFISNCTTHFQVAPQIQTMAFLKLSVLLAFFVCSTFHLGVAGNELKPGDKNENSYKEWVKKACLWCFDKYKQSPSTCYGADNCMRVVADLKSRDACNEFFKARDINYPRCNTYNRTD